ncbi:tRNA lysidine(34) synthetase TilS [Parasalinivibrio latis]|uniref:tRNA lysidine(34) synthetase TilS n=1 Tax=Parasalinivibrio latis TaxID=2952610 RepID=UPI0030E48436
MLFSSFESVLNKYSPSPRQIVLAFSGGVDSRVMLELLCVYRDTHPQHEYLLVHVHHGLSSNADSWVSLCERWADDSAMPIHIERVTLKKEGESLENAARQARYDAIAKHLKPGAILLTGQHADDQVETFFLALKRGSGPAGLAAMPESRQFSNGTLVRPLLHVRRQDIVSFAEQQGLDWIEDESNQDSRFDRNFLRNEILPGLSARWPGFHKAVKRTITLCSEQESVIDELIVGKMNEIVWPDGSLDLAGLSWNSRQVAQQIVRRWIKQEACIVPSQAQLLELFDSVIPAAEDANPLLGIGEWQIRRFQGRLYLVHQVKDISLWQSYLSLSQVTELPDGLGMLSLFPKAGGNLRLPVNGETVRVMFEPSGLSAKPVGRGGSRKLKKLFQEYGVPSWLRRRTPIVLFGDEVAAVAGLFVTDHGSGNQCDLLWHKSGYTTVNR